VRERRRGTLSARAADFAFVLFHVRPRLSRFV
jgi:hypothetical protein